MGIVAYNAQRLINIRKQGLKPKEMIIVSLIGKVNESNYTVYAQPKKTYDWQWARDLQVCVYAAPEVEWRGIARAIAYVKPSYLALWDAENQQGSQIYLLPDVKDIDKPRPEWRWQLDFLPWLPFENEAFAWN